MTIYPSDRAVPYVYICTHKETNQFYIGYRGSNVRLNRPSHLDLPKYKTSSKIVKPDWSNYTWTIVAEFFDPSDAYIFEQQLICDNWKNPLLLNKHYAKDGNKHFRNSGPSEKKGKPSGKIPWNKGISTGPSSSKGIKRGPNSDEHNQNISVALTGKTRSAEHCQNISDAMTGKTQSPETIKKRADSNRGKLSPKKGILTGPTMRVECPHCGTIGGIGGPMNRWHFDNCPKKSLPSCRPIEYMPSDLFGSDNTGPTWIDCH